MNNKLVFKTLTLLLLACGLSSLFAQEDKVMLFVDCKCEKDYLRQEMKFVRHTDELTAADVVVVVTEEGTGGGGKNYQLAFTSSERFEQADDKISVQLIPPLTEDDERKALLRGIKRGLVPYLLQTELAQKIDFDIETDDEEAEEAPVDDPWNNWVIEIYGEADLESETSQRELVLEMGVEADRVTEEVRIRTYARMEREERTVDRDDETVSSLRQRERIRGRIAWSLSDHFSAGGEALFERNTLLPTSSCKPESA